MSETITVESLSGKAIEDCIPDLARLRIEVFRDFPYLYEGNLEYEEKYLRTYIESPESIVVLARDGERVIGASTGLPLEHETEEFQKPFREHGYDPSRIFYCAESVLLKEYRGRGIYKKFFEGRESHALRLGRFDYCTFCCVQRPADHPLRPSDYVPLDAVWTRFGYVKHPELVAYYAWKDVGEPDETLKPMVFWIKSLREENR
ncbi:MAG TPA: GNAT family N-acetyltransferase [Methylococcus sp.]|nr:GNAT family N-acetyltransferase [Methylococcus sp.]